MVKRTLIIAATIAVTGALASSAPAAPVSATACSDLNYLNGALKATKKSTSALKLAQKSRWSAALVPAKTALWFARNSANPCDEDGDSYWLHRQYLIKYDVALVRWLEEKRSGDYDSADVYWSSLEFWSDNMRDIELGW